MYTVTISEKRGLEFEGEWGGAYGRIWMEEGEGRNVVIKLNFKNGSVTHWLLGLYKAFASIYQQVKFN